ncbi:MAG: TetR family transcriptional regulator [Limimaricola sp.]|uniref:TetR/AcrR family transcriptional regulator n=1 Tax=Limimaricola sp. TaxID=2211665 RepID=UPI001DCB63A5|nr:TetR/AcrR family transcriptional regulator [Limimaricola sp.]MBI1415862.1 TetR family transcriptional regulator [Limimaricola sp.]
MTSPETRDTYHHGNLKNALVAAGLEILETEGLPALTLRAIAARVGVSHTAPKNHFGSLRGLLTAIAAEGFRRHAAFMREGLGAAPDRPARLRAAMEGYVRFATTHPHLFGMMFSPIHCDFEDPALVAAAGESFAVLAGISEGLDWDKGTGPDALLKTEMMLWSMVHGYAVLTMSGQMAGATGQDDLPGIAEIMPGFGYRPAPA